jgi:hypothetical protein
MGEIIVAAIATILEWIFISIIFDLLIKLPGYFIAVSLLKFRWRKLDRETSPDELLSIFCGLLFWALVGALGYRWYQTHN